MIELSVARILMYLLFGAAAGVVNGLLGIGCGVVVIPLLVALEWPVLDAMTTSHLGVFLSSAAATYLNRHSPHLSWRKVWIIATPAIISSQVSASVAAHIPPAVILLAFSALMFIDLDIMSAAQKVRDELDSTDAPPQPLEKTFFSYLLVGMVTGVIVSLFGLGGGLVIVPLLLLLAKEPPKVAVKLSLGVMTFTSAASLIPHLLTGHLDWSVGISLGVGTIFGALFGASLLAYIPERAVRSMIVVVVMMVGVVMYGFGMFA